jgi:DNA invertase Pin-like site-specific DNA recombinase
MIAYSYQRFASAEPNDSLRTQLDKSRQYAQLHGFTLNEDSVDLRSAFRGEVSEDGLATFLKEIKAGNIPKGSTFIVEDPTLLKGSSFADSWSSLKAILDAGVDIHFLGIDQTIRPGDSSMSVLPIGTQIDLERSRS